MSPFGAPGLTQNSRGPVRKILKSGKFWGGFTAGLMALLLVEAASTETLASSGVSIKPPLVFGAAQSSYAPAAPAFAPGMPPSFADLVARVSPAVVTIEVDKQERLQLSSLDDPFGDFLFRGLDRPGRFSRPREVPMLRSRAAGSGFIIDPDGYIVTNNHVVESGRKITVHLPDKRDFDARVIGTDPDTDIALLRIDARNLPSVAFGDDRRLRVGDWVIAVGNPFGFGGTVTAGIVSSLGRDIGGGPYDDYIQIDAPINRGNSGGPAFDLSGQVVGMNTAIYSPSGGSVGIGFAIPASTIRNVVAQLKAHGNVERGWLGVNVQGVTPDIASSFGLKETKGALVAEVTPGSPASRAGFEQGDVITELNGKAIEDTRDLSREVANLRPGERAGFTVWRNGQTRVLTATIEQQTPDRLARSDSSEDDDASLGLTVMPINPALRREYGLDSRTTGVVVTGVDPESDAADKGLQPGDVITRANGKRVLTPSDLSRSVAEAKMQGRQSVLLLVADARGEHFVALKIGQG